MLKSVILSICIINYSFLVFSQLEIKTLDINWGKSFIFYKDSQEVSIPNCLSCQLLDEIPFFSQSIDGILTDKVAHLVVEGVSTSQVNDEDIIYLNRHIDKISSSPDFKIISTQDKRTNSSFITGVPFLLKNNKIVKIDKINYTISYVDLPLKAKSYASTSVLESPNKTWYKIPINNDGIYKLDKAYLTSLGINTNNLNPKHINIYGNASGRLPINNSMYRPDDLIKNPIYVQGENDNSFDENDYILFNAYGPSKWSYNGNLYRRDTNPYTNQSYYFICISSEEQPFRISSQEINLVENKTITDYDYSLIFEEDLVNLVSGGQRFYGDKFDSELSKTYSFNIPNYANATSKMRISFAYQKVSGSGVIHFYINGQLVKSEDYDTTSEDGYFRKEVELSFNPTSNIDLKMVVERSNSSIITYLDKIEVFAKKKLIYDGGTMYFRTNENNGLNNVNKYVITGMNSDVQVWDVTDRTNPFIVNGTLTGTTFSFVSSASQIREYVAFKNSNGLIPSSGSKVSPQDLHGLGFADILIVTSPNFLPFAKRLATLHEGDGSSVHVATTEQIYNEFSGGQKDPTAIRQFAKMFYDRANGNTINEPKNLILFGNGNYDPRGIIYNNDYVPAYEAEYSESAISAFTSDDFYGILDDGESFSSSDLMDIGVGRMVVDDENEAEIALNKIESYLSNYHGNTSTYGDWRLKYALIADDENYFVVEDTEPNYERVKKSNPELNATKIYADAYPQQITAGGIRLPQMEEDINRAVEDGQLVIAYVGHGGIKGAGQERFIDREQINSWNNPDKLNLFVSATCDFSRTDDPSVSSAGEVMFLNPKGGAIALMTTNRSIYYSVNSQVDSSFFLTAFKRDANYRPLTFGEIFRRTKNLAAASDNKRSFMLLGDPALRLALPNLKVVTDSINGVSVQNTNVDTLKALSKITITGHIADVSNQMLSDFNGVLTPSIFDKEKLNKTLGHIAGKTSVLDFYTQENILYKGNVSVENGKFRFSFYVPKDINYQFGKGKISYYAHNGFVDAFGFDTSIVVGGINPEGIDDDLPPTIAAYMNDTTFKNGGITDENPLFIALLSDDKGINAVGNGIGHDITLILDGNETNPIILNKYYVSDLDSYQSGSIRYQLRDLSEGFHTLRIKAWDVNNNSSTYDLFFRVVKKIDLEIENVMNYPNPVSTSTTFSFDHNQPNEELMVEITITSSSGVLAKKITTKVKTEGYTSADIVWDGTGESKTKLSNGLYLYSVVVMDSKGKIAKKNGKLILY